MQTIVRKGLVPALLRVIICFVCVTSGLVVKTSNAYAASITIPVDVQATFLRVDSSDGATDTAAIDLVALGILPGSTLDLLRLGDFGFCAACGETGLDMIGVFSSSPTLLASDQLNRVEDAIDVGGVRAFATQPTLFGGQSTDITQDFAISYNTEATNGISLIVPTGARYLFVAVPDSFYDDNFDADLDYAVKLTYESAPVPEPGTVVLFGTGLLALLHRARRRIKGT